MGAQPFSVTKCQPRLARLTALVHHEAVFCREDVRRVLVGAGVLYVRADALPVPVVLRRRYVVPSRQAVAALYDGPFEDGTSFRDPAPPEGTGP